MSLVFDALSAQNRSALPQNADAAPVSPPATRLAWGRRWLIVLAAAAAAVAAAQLAGRLTPPAGNIAAAPHPTPAIEPGERPAMNRARVRTEAEALPAIPAATPVQPPSPAAEKPTAAGKPTANVPAGRNAARSAAPPAADPVPAGRTAVAVQPGTQENAPAAPAHDVAETVSKAPAPAADIVPAAVEARARPETAAAVHDETKKSQSGNIAQAGKLSADFRVLVARGDFDGARDLLARAGSLLGEDTLTIMRLRAYLALNENKLDQARQLYSDVLLRASQDREASLNLAIIEMQQGDSQSAKARLQALQAIYPSDPDISQYLSATGPN